MTLEVRQDFNKMSDALNAAIQDAVKRNSDKGVTFIDIENVDGEDKLKGHRYCEPGVKEPDTKNDKLYFWHYPYNEAKDNDDPTIKLLQDTYKQVVGDLSTQDINSKYPKHRDLENAIFDALDETKIKDKADAHTAGWDSIGYRARVFHPQVQYHKFIQSRIKESRKAEEPQQTPPEDPKPTKALSINFETKYDHTEGAAPEWVTLWFKRTWLFYEHNIGDPVGCFDRENAWQFEEPMSEKKDDMPDWPANPEINREDFDEPSILPQGCYYRNDGTNAGRLFCPDLPGGGVNCKEHEDRKNPDKWYECGDEARRRAAVVCEW